VETVHVVTDKTQQYDNYLHHRYTIMCNLWRAKDCETWTTKKIKQHGWQNLHLGEGGGCPCVPI